MEAREEKGLKQDFTTGRVMASARRSLYGRTPVPDRNGDEGDSTKKTRNSEVTVSSDNISTIMQSLQSISSELKAVERAYHN